eukprot:935895-Amphidinium_carterae.1
MQTKWVTKPRPGNSPNKRLKARFVADVYTQNVKFDELAVHSYTSRNHIVLLWFGQIRQHKVLL